MNDTTPSADYLDKGFLGHPIGLRTLFLTEMWERMSFYGMRGLLVLFMTAEVFNGGFAISQSEANTIVAIYVGMVYFMSLPGGWIADRLLGKQKAVLYGGIIIALGHYCLAVPMKETFYIGLSLVVLGTGLLKPNISAIVGELYTRADPRRDAGFTIFYMAINIGSFLGFLICGYLGENVNWHYGFGAAGIGMTFGVAQYILTLKNLGGAGTEIQEKDPNKRKQQLTFVLVVVVALFAFVLAGIFGLWALDAILLNRILALIIGLISIIYFVFIYFFGKLNPLEKKNMVMIVFLFLGAAAFWAGFDQSAGSFNNFAKYNTNLSFFGLFEMPASWVQLINPTFVVLFAPFFAALWLRLGAKNMEPGAPVKFAFGVILNGFGFLIMVYAVYAAVEAADGRVGVQWLLLVYLFQTLGELSLSPVGLSAMSKYSPKRYSGQMMGVWFLASAFGGMIAGQIGFEAASEGLSFMDDVFLNTFYALAGLGVVLIVASRFIKGEILED